MHVKKTKLPSIAKYKKTIREKYFNLWIRRRDSDPHTGYGQCCTCNKWLHYTEGNAGHFQHGLDFFEENQHLQCVYCNKWNHGRLDKYTLFMQTKYGQEVVDRLIFLKDNHPGYSRIELDQIKEKYKSKLEESHAC